MSRLASILSTLVLVTLSAMLQPASAAGVYDGQQIVRVWPATPGQRLAVEQMQLDLMSESVRTDGGTEYLADAEALALLEAAGVAFDVVVADVQAMVDAERARIDARQRWGEGPVPRGDDTFFAEFRDFGEINTLLDQLVAAHPDLISRETIGASLEGRPIEAFTISGAGSADDKSSLIFHGMIHAREWISPMTVTYIMRELVEGYGSDARITDLLDGVAFRVVPVLNPDGFVYSWEHERFWRKNRRNGYGVDLNRNFSTGWGGPGSSGWTGSQTYRGDAPFSEPETQAIRDYLLSVPNRALHIDYHSYSQLVLWPPGFENDYIPPPDGPIMEALGTAYTEAIWETTGANYTPQRGVDLYIASGISTDWAYAQAGVYGWTVELRPGDALGGSGGFAPPPDQILPCAQENLAAVLGLADSVVAGVMVNPESLPETVQPGVAGSISVEIVPSFVETLDGATVDLFSRVGSIGEFESSPMSAQGNVYTGSLDAGPCGSWVEYFVGIVAAGGRESVWPEGEPVSVDVVRTAHVALDDMETDAGWTVGAPGDTATTGVWELADPIETSAQPEDDHTPGVGVLCWVTDAAVGLNHHTNDVDDGATTLTSPRYDLSATWDERELSFWLWYYTSEDPFEIDISADDGQNWEPLDRVEYTTYGWVKKTYPLTGAYASSDALRVRFVARDEGLLGSLIEAALDDLDISAVGCSGNPADLAEPFGVLDAADITAFVTAFIAGDPAADLVVPDGVIDLADIVAFVRFFGQGAP